MNQYEIILKAFDVMVANKIWHDVTASQLLKILMYLHGKQWIYIPTINGEACAVIAAYRIKEISDECMTKVPVKEEGNILYIPMAISLKGEEDMYKIVRESLRLYIKENPDIEKLVLEDKNEKLKVYNLKGEQDGKKAIPTASSTANVSAK